MAELGQDKCNRVPLHVRSEQPAPLCRIFIVLKQAGKLDNLDGCDEEPVSDALRELDLFITARILQRVMGHQPHLG